MKQRVIFHIDVNSAFLSWSAANHLFMGGTTDYRNINAAIANEDSGKSIILAKSQGAKAMGVVTAEPIWVAREKCPDLKIIRPDYHLYLRASAAMKKLFFDYTPLVEPYSIDECFLDMTGQEKFFGEPEKAAYIIKERIKEELGFTVNVGIGDNKPLAKMASEFEKPDLIHTLWFRQIAEKLWPMPIEFLFMAGKKSVQKLRKIGVDTIGKLANLDHRFIIDFMGKQGDMLYCYANGIDDSSVLPGELPPPKSVSQSITVPIILEDINDAETIFLYIAEHLAAKLRKQKVVASVISVAVKDKDRCYKSKQRRVAGVLLHRRAIFENAMELLREIWPAQGGKYIGITLSNFTTDYTLDGNLFDDDIIREERLDDVVYQIKNRYGNDAILSGRLLNSGVSKFFRDVEDEDSLENEPPRFF